MCMPKYGLKCMLGHCLCHMMMTALANSPGVSMAEQLAVARHSYVSANHVYQQCVIESESARFDALLGEPKEKGDDDAGGGDGGAL